jgi:hypothetical protein
LKIYHAAVHSNSPFLELMKNKIPIDLCSQTERIRSRIHYNILSFQLNNQLNADSDIYESIPNNWEWKTIVILGW